LANVDLFLARDATYSAARTVPSQNVCPSRCLSVRLTYPQTFTKSRSHTILLLLHTKRYGNITTGTLILRRIGLRMHGWCEKLRFSTNISLYLGNNTRQP